jgi:hypothetical protein
VKKSDGEVRFSTKAIFIVLVLSLCLSLVPIILGRLYLPGNMVLARNNSAVISAACHAIPTEASDMTGIKALRQRLLYAGEESRQPAAAAPVLSPEIRAERRLWQISTQSVKWGVVSKGLGTEESPGHLAFGAEDQDIEPPFQGCYYAGHKS